TASTAEASPAPDPSAPSTPSTAPSTPPAGPSAQRDLQRATTDSAPVGARAIGPESTVAPPYLSWNVVDQHGDPVPGATFEIAGPRTSASAWGTARTVADCTAAPCTGLDLDSDPGEFQLKNLTATQAVSPTARYRVRLTGVPSGYVLGSTAWVEQPGSGNTPSGSPWTTFDFGAFTVTRNPALTCAANTFYSLQDDGSVRQVVSVPGGASDSATVTTIGGWTGTARSGVNALAIADEGTALYALDRSANGNDVTDILRYTRDGGWVAVPSSGYVAGFNTTLTITGGAINLSTGRYLYGGFYDGGATLSYALFEYNPVTNASRRLGTFATTIPDTSTANGDIAFDRAGNLYIVRSGGGNANIFSLTAQTIAGANGGALAVSASASQSLTLQNVNGIAFEGDGSVYLANGTTVMRYNPTTWAQIGNRVTQSLGDSTDLASCSSPANLTVVKNVVSRVAASDQFALTVRSGTTTVATATTTGSATGVQTERVGPIPVIAGSTYTVSEAMASGSADNYASGLICLNGTTQLPITVDATGRSAAVPIPNVSGASIVCTFTNSPLVSPVSISKTVLSDDAAATPRPGSGWTTTMGATRSGTTGAVTATPTTTPAGVTNAEGRATWSVRYSTTATRAIVTVSETQKSDHVFVSGQCVLTPLSGPPTTVALTGESASALPAIAPGTAVDCTYVNKPKPSTLVLIKRVAFGDADPKEWTLTATAPTGALAGPTGPTGSAQATGTVTSAVPYILAEDRPAGRDAYVQSGSWSCTDQTGRAVAVTGGDRITVATPGDTVTCVVTNTTARLTLLKRVEGSTVAPSTWTLTATPAANSFAFPVLSTLGAASASAQNTWEVRPGQRYALDEAVTAAGGDLAYLQDRIEVSHDGGRSWTTVSDASSVAVAAGQHSLFRIVNTPPPAIPLPLTGGTATDAFLFAGALIVALGLGSAAWYARRTRRSRMTQ
ncbi:MAG: LPXTG cell wall anchor domain-containing protein, partial [Aeromicrobium sp.]